MNPHDMAEHVRKLQQIAEAIVFSSPNEARDLFCLADTLESIRADPVVVMNRAFQADPDAIHAMICNRVPCNLALADDPTVVCDDSKVSNGFTVGAIGLFNGILGEMRLPLLAHKWSDPGEDGRRTLLGFQMYVPRHAPEKPHTSDPE